MRTPFLKIAITMLALAAGQTSLAENQKVDRRVEGEKRTGNKISQRIKANLYKSRNKEDMIQIPGLERSHDQSIANKYGLKPTERDRRLDRQKRKKRFTAVIDR